MIKRVKLLLCLLPLFFGCRWDRTESQFLGDKSVLKVVTRMSGTTYYKDRNGSETGYEYDLLRAFAKAHGLELKMIVESSIEEVLDAVEYGKADIYAAGITRTKKREKKYSFGPKYFEVQQQLVCRNRTKINTPMDFTKLDIKIVANSSYEETLGHLKKEVSGLTWQSVSGVSSEKLIEDLWDETKGCTLADSNIVKIHRRYFPELKVVYTFPQKEELAWIVKSGNQSLLKKVDSWFKEKETKALKDKLYLKYYGHIGEFDFYDTKKYIERIDSRLPKYASLLKDAAKKYDFHWKYLAAVAYQESQWDPKATSPTGVRGFMMLTKNTARSLGVNDRLDAKESIFGGAEYLRQLHKKIPPHVPQNERRWLALASYNVGYYHLRDAQALALLKEYNPFQWSGVKNALPLLSEARYFKKLWYGYARGQEPVVYVDRIKNYYEILRKVYDENYPNRSAVEK